MKQMEEIVDYLKDVIVEVMLGNVSKINLKNNSLLMEEIGLDSLDYASVMLAGEEFVNSKLDENKINWRDIKTIEDLAKLLEESQ